MTVDFILNDVTMLVTRNNSREYQESVIKTSTSLFHFLKSNHLLVNIEPFDKEGNLNLDTVLKVSNVTEDGLTLFKNGVISGWYQYLDKSKSPEKYNNISRLEKGLAKLREK